MLTHHVLFWLKDEYLQDYKVQFKNGLQQLEQIEVIKSFYIGEPAPISRAVVDTTYTFSLLLIFENLEAHDAYQIHPIHKDFLDKHRHTFEKVVIYDSQ